MPGGAARDSSTMYAGACFFVFFAAVAFAYSHDHLRSAEHDPPVGQENATTIHHVSGTAFIVGGVASVIGAGIMVYNGYHAARRTKPSSFFSGTP